MLVPTSRAPPPAAGAPGRVLLDAPRLLRIRRPSSIVPGTPSGRVEALRDEGMRPVLVDDPAAGVSRSVAASDPGRLGHVRIDEPERAGPRGTRRRPRARPSRGPTAARQPFTHRHQSPCPAPAAAGRPRAGAPGRTRGSRSRPGRRSPLALRSAADRADLRGLCAGRRGGPGGCGRAGTASPDKLRRPGPREAGAAPGRVRVSQRLTLGTTTEASQPQRHVGDDAEAVLEGDTEKNLLPENRIERTGV